MKHKGINRFEEHVEKIVLAVMAVVFLGVLAAQFLAGPAKVQVGRHNPSLPEAYRVVSREAENLLARMNEASPELPEHAEASDPAESFQLALHSGISPSPSLAGGQRGISVEMGTGAGPIEGQRIAVVTPPAPRRGVASTHTSTLSPTLLHDFPELRPYLPSAQPLDKAVVTAEAVFDGAELRRLLEADPGGEDVAAMPANWWSGRMRVLGVVLERQERTETGEWTNTTRISAIPGRTDLLSEIREMQQSEGVPLRMDQVLARAEALARDVQRPPYYAALAGPRWTPPHMVVAAEEGVDTARVRADQLLRLRKEKVARIERMNRLIETRRARNIEQVQQNVQQLREELVELDDELRDMGIDPRRPDAAAGLGYEEPEQPPELLRNPEVRVWAHDLTARAGGTYRYRLAVVVNNPAFGRGAFLHVEQQDLAERPVLESNPSPWSEPVSLADTTAYFITGASPGTEGSLGGMTATVEVFRFYYGYWRRGTARVEPGDVIQTEVQLPPHLYTFDMAALADLAGEAERVQIPEYELFDEEGEPIEPPEWLIRVPERLSASVGVQLLDVTTVVGGPRRAGQRPPLAVVIRDGPGQLLVRRPDRDTASELYRRLSESARIGQTQTRPEPRDEAPLIPPDVLPGDPIPVDPRGGGGGGAGGG
jgi:hypothetical protein